MVHGSHLSFQDGSWHFFYCSFKLFVYIQLFKPLANSDSLVLEPESLREEIRTEAKTLLIRYEKEGGRKRKMIFGLAQGRSSFQRHKSHWQDYRSRYPKGAFFYKPR